MTERKKKEKNDAASMSYLTLQLRDDSLNFPQLLLGLGVGATCIQSSVQLVEQ